MIRINVIVEVQKCLTSYSFFVSLRTQTTLAITTLIVISRFHFNFHHFFEWKIKHQKLLKP